MRIAAFHFYVFYCILSVHHAREEKEMIVTSAERHKPPPAIKRKEEKINLLKYLAVIVWMFAVLCWMLIRGDSEK